MNPFFSVVISVYNKEDYISGTIRSVINQTFQDFEVIIVNDGSTDKSLKIINQFDDPRIIIINQENKGASHARNQGIKSAKGTFIALLDGDDLWDEKFLENIHKAIYQYPDESVFTSAIAHKYNTEIQPVSYSFNSKKEILILDYFEASQDHTILSGSSTVFRKSIIAVTGNFDESITSGEDTDLWIRFGIHHKIIFINKILVYYIFINDSLSNSDYNLKMKPKFDKYIEEEKNNHYLKKFLDRNRFSLSILSKLHNDKDSFEFYKNSLSVKNLTFKRQVLLNSPKWLILALLKLKSLTGKKLYYKS
ncbi:glycosyltransferase family 2 protein [Psychroserpens sp. Hel_I_66]|uniref:glycosyltransferase family 2 protein n=1 Tax=Psychroserpens sp. Hel_I_66 TaxID=1250004 RepID=UPI000646461C|nr:glycosyltransferase family 2 protein [Psychroserpens sp. Hel_I_66]